MIQPVNAHNEEFVRWWDHWVAKLSQMQAAEKATTSPGSHPHPDLMQKSADEHASQTEKQDATVEKVRI